MYRPVYIYIDIFNSSINDKRCSVGKSKNGETYTVIYKYKIAYSLLNSAKFMFQKISISPQWLGFFSRPPTPLEIQIIISFIHFFKFYLALQNSPSNPFHRRVCIFSVNCTI